MNILITYFYTYVRVYYCLENYNWKFFENKKHEKFHKSDNNTTKLWEFKSHKCGMQTTFPQIFTQLQQ